MYVYMSDELTLLAQEWMKDGCIFERGARKEQGKIHCRPLVYVRANDVIIVVVVLCRYRRKFAKKKHQTKEMQQFCVRTNGASGFHMRKPSNTIPETHYICLWSIRKGRGVLFTCSPSLSDIYWGRLFLGSQFSRKKPWVIMFFDNLPVLGIVKISVSYKNDQDTKGSLSKKISNMIPETYYIF